MYEVKARAGHCDSIKREREYELVPVCIYEYVTRCDAYLVLELLNTTGQDGSDQKGYDDGLVGVTSHNNS
jgi:hypothetical protein